MFCPARLGENVGELTFQGNDMGQLARYTLPLYLLNFLQFVIILEYPYANSMLCGGKFQAIGPKRCYLGEGYGILDRPGALKGAISEKEIVIFEL